MFHNFKKAFPILVFPNSFSVVMAEARRETPGITSEVPGQGLPAPEAGNSASILSSSLLEGRKVAMLLLKLNHFCGALNAPGHYFKVRRGRGKGQEGPKIQENLAVFICGLPKQSWSLAGGIAHLDNVRHAASSPTPTALKQALVMLFLTLSSRLAFCQKEVEEREEKQSSSPTRVRLFNDDDLF